MKFESVPQFNPEEKSQERLQAQAEIFADRGVENFSEDQAQILKYSAELSNIKDLNNLPPDLPEEAVDLIQKHKDTYVSFLRQERTLETSFIEENIKTYKEKFRTVIAELKAKMAQGNFKELPEYLGSGSNGSAFRLEVDGKTYAAKFSRITQANFEIKPLLRAKGIPHTSQLISYSFEDGVVIMELLPGTDVSQFNPIEAPEYSDEHIVHLIDTVREMDAKGLVIDPKPSNFMYDPENGFSILDYHLKNASSRYGLPQEVMDLRHVLLASKLDYDKEKTDADVAEKYKIYIENLKKLLLFLTRFLGILKEKYPEILAEWRRQHDEDKKDPNVRVVEIVERKYILQHFLQHPDIEPHLKKLEEMGF